MGDVLQKFLGALQERLRRGNAANGFAVRVVCDELPPAVLTDHLLSQVLDANLQPATAGWAILHKVRGI